MLKAGIFLDMENLNMNGGWGIRFDVIRKLVEAQGTTVLRANVYIAVDNAREKYDFEYREKAQARRDKMRLAGFHIVEKEIRRFTNADGTQNIKANADLDLAVDAMLQAENLDYILLGTGDGDFLRLVRALQSKGKRVDAVAIHNVSGELRREVDYYFHGATIPGLLPIKNDPKKIRHRGVLDYVNEEKGFGFLSIRTGYQLTDIESGIFCHISQLTEDGIGVSNDRFSALASNNAVIEFDKIKSERGGFQAENALVYK
ncbi:NYN domain-containing protein [Teredinibacter turnerae]|uniref:LabA-like NYN domain-containing protein n=1 Tax=Teredinibacter turnerae TaxID=2426 RepID=UPI0003FF7ED1|nr:NYN domain-containing protein [Teredinibacter turnerae]